MIDLEDCADQTGEGESAEQEARRPGADTVYSEHHMKGPNMNTAPQTRGDLTPRQRVEETYARYGYARGSTTTAMNLTAELIEEIERAIESDDWVTRRTTILSRARRLHRGLERSVEVLDSDDLIGYHS